jgi:hypothetical protein
MSLLVPDAAVTPLERHALQLKAFGELQAISRLGGQGRVHRPARIPPELGTDPVVVKLYRRTPTVAAARVLAAMVAWSRSLEHAERIRLHQMTTWPLTVVSSGLMPVGIAMQDVSGRFAVPFVMPSGRRERVLLALEHLLGDDAYLQLRGLGIALDTLMRARVAERVSDALAYLHRHAIVVSDLAPSNLLLAFDRGLPSVCFIDCDSMVFQGQQGLAPVETGDWDIPAEFGEPPRTRSADAYKLGLLMLRLFARSHDARVVEPHLRYVPADLRGLLARALARDAPNRPPAGEWQRALREVLNRRDLNEHYPGPAPRVEAPHPVVRLAPTSVGAAAAAPAPPAQIRSLRPLPRPTGRAPAGSPRSQAGSPWLRPAVVALWMLAGVVVFVLVLSRLFAATIQEPPQQKTINVYPSGGYQTPPGSLQGSGGAAQVP